MDASQIGSPPVLELINHTPSGPVVLQRALTGRLAQLATSQPRTPPTSDQSLFSLTEADSCRHVRWHCSMVSAHLHREHSNITSQPEVQFALPQLEASA